jgi:hypothetical protein
VTFHHNASISNIIYNVGVEKQDDKDFGSAYVNVVNSILWDDLGNEIDTDKGTSTIASSLVFRGCPENATCTNVSNTDPLLGGFFDQGGFAPTMLPTSNSPAINAGDDTRCPYADQRGELRLAGSHCDIGATERQSVEEVIFKDGFDRRPWYLATHGA